MTYRPDNQALAPGIQTILEGIEELQAALSCRQKDAEEWNDSHIEELCDIELKLVKMKHELSQLNRDTW